MPKLQGEKLQSVECGYPAEFPTAAVKELLHLAKSGAWLANGSAAARAIWSIEGWAYGVLIDNAPLGTADVPALHQLREAVHAGLQTTKGQTGRPLAGGDVRPDASVATVSRILESSLTGLLTKLAFLRKLASEVIQ